ncbi:MAG: hypothetical protein CGW95_12270 [Phenylobacterium zucineum]|nr:MAG: hypothetical protein CGW95_12270 [Phenylobacterium zucineum]
MVYKLYGTPGSLYTGKARSYLIKQGIPFENRAAGEARFRAQIVPQTGRWIIPILEADDGALVQDGSEIIALFDAHLAASPYLLGGRPTLGDYGLIAPLYAHLARDPYPAQIMKQTAFRVWRWTERMNAADQDAGEYGEVAPDLFGGDRVPGTLKAYWPSSPRTICPRSAPMSPSPMPGSPTTPTSKPELTACPANRTAASA